MATHAVGADLTYSCLNNNTYEVTLTFYRDCMGSVPAPGIDTELPPKINIFSASCGIRDTISLDVQSQPDGELSVEISPTCDGELENSTCNGGTLQGVEQFTYTGIYTFPEQCKDWILSFSLRNRNGAITNSINAESYPLYVESLLNNFSVSCNNAPVFTTPPVPYICVGQEFNYNHGVYDVEGDSLVYQLAAPLSGSNNTVPYVTGFSPTYPIETTPPNSVSFDTESGQMGLTPGLAQIGIVAVLVKEYRDGQLIGSTIRDMQVVVIDCLNEIPIINTPSNISGGQFDGSTFQVCAGNTLSFDIQAEDNNMADVLAVMDNLALSIPDATLTVVGTNPITASFNWSTTPDDAGNHSFAMIIEDDACPVYGFQVLGYEILVPGIEVIASDTLICSDTAEDIRLTANLIGGSNTGTYSWTPTTGLNNPNIRNPIATVSSPITYTLTYDDGICTVSDEVNIQAESTLIAMPEIASVCAGTPVQLATQVTTILDIDACGAILTNCANEATTIDIGTDITSTGPTNVDDESGTPYLQYYEDGRTQILYSAFDLQNAGLTDGLITEIAFEISNQKSVNPYNFFTIRMGCTDIETFQADDVFADDLEYVYTRQQQNTQEGWNTYTLDEPYQWDGTSNIILNICFNNDENTWSSYDHVFYTKTGYNSVLFDRRDNANGCVIQPEYISDRRPNTRFTICDPASSFNVDYSWSPAVGLDYSDIPNPIVFPVVSTTYIVTAMTQQGCTLTDTVQITVGELNIEIESTDTDCGQPGSIDLEVSGGVEPYTYDWNEDALDGIEDPNNLLAGIYQVTVTDVNSCNNSATIAINSVNSSMTLTVTNDTINCDGDISGSLSVEAMGGVGGYTYEWDNGETTSTISGLLPGTYTVTVTDADDCAATAQAMVSTNAALSVTAIGDTLACFGDNDGMITLDIEGGVEPYDFDWDNAPDVQNPAGLGIGTYQVSITDANNCTIRATANIIQPDELTATITGVNGTSCGSTDNGTATANALGGTPPYTFLWDNNENTPSANMLAQGIHTLSVTDSEGCMVTDSATIASAAQIQVNASSSPATCFGDRDGSININVSGGLPPYSYSPNGENYQSDSELNGLTAGIYTVYVKDAAGCIQTDTTIVEQPLELLIDIPENTTIDFGESIVLETSLNQFVGATYLWTSLGDMSCNDCSNPVVAPTFQTAYSLTIITDEGCRAEADVTIFVSKKQPVFIPNAFTPNGDNVNDVFMVHGGEAVKQIKVLRVFDRWGEIVFESINTSPNNPASGWDGSMNGEELNQGIFVYFVEVEFIDGVRRPYSGELTLIR